METDTLAVALNAMINYLRRNARRLPMQQTDALANAISEIATELHGRGVSLFRERIKVAKGEFYELPSISMVQTGPKVGWVPEV